MRIPILTGLVALVLACGQTATGGDEPAATPQVEFRLSILQGDPLGSREEGTLKYLAEPCLVTTLGTPASFFAGGEVPLKTELGTVGFIPIGLHFAFTPKALKDGKVYLELAVEESRIAHSTNDRTYVQTQGSKVTGTFHLGEVIKLKCNDTKPGEQMWVEMTVHEAKK